MLIELADLGFLSIDMSSGLKYLAGILTYDAFADNSTYVSICCKVGDNGAGHQCPVFKQNPQSRCPVFSWILLNQCQES